MLIVTIIFSTIYVILLLILIKAYYRDVTDVDKRIIVLEKRLEEYRKSYANYYKNLFDMMVEFEYEIEELRSKSRRKK